MVSLDVGSTLEHRFAVGVCLYQVAGSGAANAFCWKGGKSVEAKGPSFTG